MLYTQLRSFHAVAREGGFTAASKLLNIGQPTITSQVKSLEERYGIELFHRRGRRVELSEAGVALFAVTQRLMSVEAEAKDLLNALGGFHSGHLKLAAVGPFHATGLIAAFHTRFPGVKVSMSFGNTQQVLDSLLDFSADAAVVDQFASDDERFVTLPYGRHSMILFVRKDHPWGKRRGVKLAEVTTQPLVLRERGSMTRRAVERAFTERGIAIEPTFEIGSREGVWLAVRQGLGVGIVSEIEFVPHPDLHALKITDVTIETQAVVACLVERQDTRLLKIFLEVVHDVVAKA